MKRQITEEEIDLAVEMYNSGNTILAISKKLHRTEKTISTKLKERGVVVRNKNFYTEELINTVRLRYENGESLTKICKELGIEYDKMSPHLKKIGVKIINRQNKTKFNENIFDVIDTEEKAYWLGFIYADGYLDSSPLKNNQKSYYSFGIGLQIQDWEHLLKFNEFMGHEKINLYTYIKDPKRPSCIWRVRNRHLWETLNSYGCTPQKSLTVKFPDKKIFKDKKLIKNFIHGYFDGDGDLSYNKNIRKTSESWVVPKLGFTGAKTFLEPLAKWLKKELGINYRWTHDKRHSEFTWHLNYNKKESLILLNYFYKDAKIHLNRKYKRYELLKDGRCSLKKFNELLSGNIGGTPKLDNTEIIERIKDLQHRNA